MRIITEDQLQHDEKRLKERLDFLRKTGNTAEVERAEALLLRVQCAKSSLQADSFKAMRTMMTERYIVHKLVKGVC